MYAPDIPAYYHVWESLIGSTDAIFGPLHLALMHKRVEVVR